MATKSSNTKGNPYHDENTGEFTSSESSSGKKEELNSPAFQQPTGEETKKSFKLKTDVSLDDAKKSLIENNTKKTFKLKGNASLDDARQQLARHNQIASIPFLSSANDVEQHLEEFFPKEIVENIDSYFGKYSVPYKFFNLRTDPNQRCGCNIFAAFIGKKRWKDNCIKIIDSNEYFKLSSNRNFQLLYRGLNTRTDDEFNTIADSYSSKENLTIYGSVGGTCYGIAVYASSSQYEARGYAGGNSRHVMNLVLNKNAKTMSYRNICRIRDDLQYRKNSIIPKVEKIFLDNGIEPSRAKQMAASFGISLGDEGFVAMLCGVEWYTDSGSYHMIENLGTLFRKL